ncbi:hypothetical protein L2E82_29828 [Cichorium intybus]|uniref:Uncharacterized protein n=1 Tax=Cichorium intybus TaxID=13427 RepID=A0ACB9CYL5_CICIN|nr:hypothetical protein L2E82_29828 [Cichorium intybus]
MGPIMVTIIPEQRGRVLIPYQCSKDAVDFSSQQVCILTTQQKVKESDSDSDMEEGEIKDSSDEDGEDEESPIWKDTNDNNIRSENVANSFSNPKDMEVEETEGPSKKDYVAIQNDYTKAIDVYEEGYDRVENQINSFSELGHDTVGTRVEENEPIEVPSLVVADFVMLNSPSNCDGLNEEFTQIKSRPNMRNLNHSLESTSLSSQKPDTMSKRGKKGSMSM